MSPAVFFPSEASLSFAAQQGLLRKGLRVPRDASLIVLDGHHTFEWLVPDGCQVRADTRRRATRVLQWVGNLAKGREDRRETLIRADFAEGGTIGSAPGPSSGKEK